MSEKGIKVLEKRRVPGEGLRLMLSQLIAFPKPVRFYNPDTGFMEERARFEVLFDASIPEKQYRAYEEFSVGRESKERILILLAVLGYSYPSTAVSEGSGVALSTTRRLLWELKRDGLLEGAFSHGAYVDSDIWPYRYGPLRENYWMLTEEGSRRAAELMTTRVVPLAPPREVVEVEREEFPWEAAGRRAEEARKRLGYP